MKKVCPTCSNEFELTSSGQLYCSNECKKAFKLSSISTKLKIFTCAFCLQPFESNRKRKYCLDCKQIAYSRKSNYNKRTSNASESLSLSLDQVNALARESGLSYGKYTALHKEEL